MEIANLVELHHYVELEDMVHMAIKIENQQKRRGSSTCQNPSVSSSSWKPNFARRGEQPTIVKPKIESK